MKFDNQIIDKINEYYITSKLQCYYHLKAAEKFKLLYVYTTTPIIVISSITTVLASYNGNIIDVRLAIAVAICSGITTVGQALIAFFEYNTQYTEHINTSNKYTNLARMIETEFFTNYTNISTDAETAAYIKYLFGKLYSEFMNIQNNAPYLATSISEKKYTNVQYGAENINDPLIVIDKNNQIITPITPMIIPSSIIPNTGSSMGMPPPLPTIVTNSPTA
jgi:hypothetical protein